MKKTLCAIMSITIMMSLTSCMPPKSQVDYHKEIKEKFQEEHEELQEILDNDKVEETQAD